MNNDMWPHNELDNSLHSGEERYYGSEKIKIQSAFYHRHSWKIAVVVLAVVVVSLLLYILNTLRVVPVLPGVATSQPSIAVFSSGTWRGKGIYYSGGGFDMTLNVTVNGTFSGTLQENVYNSVVAISGSITSSFENSVNLTFTDNAAVSGGQIQLDCTYTGTVSNGQMSGVWFYPGHSSPDGTFTLGKT